LDESKADKLTLEPILGCFMAWKRARGSSPYPELFPQSDESKRAKKMLELVIPSFFRHWMRVRLIS
jgi:hypothetical protein